MSLELTDAAKSLLGERGFDPVLGARPLRRTIQREIEDKLSEKILFDEIRPGQIVLVDVVDATDALTGKPTKEFTFRGEPRPSSVPDSVPAGLAIDAGPEGATG